MKVTIIIDRPVVNYEFAYSTSEVFPVNTSDWYDSNILTINTKGTYYIFVRDKVTKFIESVKSIYLSCIEGELVCNIDYIKPISISKCTITPTKILGLTKIIDTKVCTISYVKPVSISRCYITATSIKKINN